MLVGFAIDLEGLVPGPHAIDKLPVRGLRELELGEGVAVVVGGHVEGSLGVVAADHEGAFDDRVVGHAVDRGGAEDELARCLEAGEETA